MLLHCERCDCFSARGTARLLYPAPNMFGPHRIGHRGRPCRSPRRGLKLGMLQMSFRHLGPLSRQTPPAPGKKNVTIPSPSLPGGDACSTGEAEAGEKPGQANSKCCAVPISLFSLFKKATQITSQRLLDQSQAGVYMGKTPHTPPFGPIRVPYPKGLNC